jgi:ATP phosphoribosyltransferase regulatory subunit
MRLSNALQDLVHLYGDEQVLSDAQRILPDLIEVQEALNHLKWLASHLASACVSFDLADLRGYAYYSGAMFSLYAPSSCDALARGGRYDEVGSIFGRKRPAVGFSLDVKSVAAAATDHSLRAAIRAPWSEGSALRAVIASLRHQGETVVCVLPGHENEIDEFRCNRELRLVDGQWNVQSI